jgi:hypothetical protein
MIVLSEASSRLEPSASARDIRIMTDTAQVMGCRIYAIPQDFELCETAENALAHIPAPEHETPTVWIGYIPTPERYAAVHAAARAKNLRLVNSPEEHLRAQEFDRAYPLLGDLTPKSIIVTSPDECAAAGRKLNFPVFVKGAVQSRKLRGWKACVAENEAELAGLARVLLFELDERTRGRVIVRELARLRHARVSAQGFPFGREYRVFILKGEIVGLGYYWEGDDPLMTLSDGERRIVSELALEAAARLGVPYVAVDIGQCEDGRWIVIETGDAQFSGISRISPIQLWSNLQQVGESG